MLDTKCKLTLMKLLLVHIIGVTFLISLIYGNFFLFFIHVIYTCFKLLKHKSNVRLGFRWKGLFVLDCLRVKVKDHDIFVHSVPLAREDFRPKLFG